MEWTATEKKKQKNYKNWFLNSFSIINRELKTIRRKKTEINTKKEKKNSAHDIELKKKSLLYIIFFSSENIRQQQPSTGAVIYIGYVSQTVHVSFLIHVVTKLDRETRVCVFDDVGAFECVSLAYFFLNPIRHLILLFMLLLLLLVQLLVVVVRSWASWDAKNIA